MAFDTFVGLPLDQSIASAAWDSGGMAWSAGCWLAGNGANAVKSTQVAPNQGFANYASLTGQIGQAVFFKIAPGRVTTNFAIAIYIDGDGTHDQYAPGAAVRAAVGAYGSLVLRDMAANLETSIACAISDNTEYCLEVYKTTNVSGKEYRATMYAASGGVRGAAVATQIISLVAAVPGTNKRVQLATMPEHQSLLSINRVESVDGAAADTTAPVLSAPSATATGSTTATGTVATDEGGGVLFYLATTNATELTATLEAAASQAVTATGAQTVYFTGLTAGTTYYPHYLHRDAALNKSAVSNGASSFTTPSPDAVAPTFTGGSVITPGTITASTLAFSYPAATDNVAVAGYQTSKDGGATWSDNGTGLSGTFTGLAASTTYQIWVRAKDAAGNYSTPLQLSMTTSAAAAGTFSTPVIKNNAGTILANEAGVVVNIYSATTGALVVRKTGQTSNASGVLTVTDALLVAGTSYAYEVVLASNGRRLPVAAAA